MAPEQRAANLEVLRGEELTCAELARRMESGSLFAGSRLVAVRQVHELGSQGQDLLSRVLDSPPPGVVLALFTSRGLPRGALGERLRKAALTVDCEPLKGSELRRYLQAGLARDQVTITGEALELVIALVGEDLTRLRQESEKLVLSLGPGGGRIDADRVESLLSGRRLRSVFELTNSLGDKEPGRRLALLERLLEQGEPPLKIVFWVADQLRLYLEVKSLKRQGIAPTQAAGLLGIHPFRVRESYAQAEHFGRADLENSLLRLQHAEMDLKTSASSPRQILEWFFLEA